MAVRPIIAEIAVGEINSSQANMDAAIAVPSVGVMLGHSEWDERRNLGRDGVSLAKLPVRPRTTASASAAEPQPDAGAQQARERAGTRSRTVRGVSHVQKGGNAQANGARGSEALRRVRGRMTALGISS
ncbi:hypothetical protein EI94DRAFT_1818019 [Lactarius quietus]|nr:hypothetical protein EI94DRAFT_1818019 [Lactarius quietus]